MQDLRPNQIALLERHRELSHDVVVDALAAYEKPTAHRGLLSQPRPVLVSAGVSCVALAIERHDVLVRTPGVTRLEPVDWFPFEVIARLQRRKLPYAPEDAELLLDLSPSTWRAELALFAVAAAGQVLATSPGSPAVLAGLERARRRIDEDAAWHIEGFRDVSHRIATLLAASAPGGLLDLSVIDDQDGWADIARNVLHAHAAHRHGVQDVVAHLAAARGSHPTKRWWARAEELLTADADLPELARQLLEPVLDLELVATPYSVAWPPSWLLAPGNEVILRGAAWILRGVDARWVVPLLGRLALRCSASSPDDAVTTALSAPVASGAIDSLIARRSTDSDAHVELVRLLGEIQRRDVVKRIATAVGEAPDKTTARDDAIRRQKGRAVRAKADPQPAVNQRAANVRVRSELVPRLREVGFAGRRGRTFWRHEDNRVEVVHVASIRGELMLRAGVWFRQPRRLRSPRLENGMPHPDEADCDLRATFDADDLLTACGRAEAWFVRWRQLDGVLAFLLSDDDDPETHGHGAPESAMRSYLIGYLALEAGRRELARVHLGRAATWHGAQLDERRTSYPRDVTAEQEAWIAGLDADARSA